MNFLRKTNQINTFYISNELIIKGNIEGNISGRIEGLVKGDVTTNSKIIIAVSGVIEGNIKCDELIVEGVVHGDVIANKSIVVSASGKIYGNVSSNSINVNPLSVVEGSLSKITAQKSLGKIVHVNAATEETTKISKSKTGYW